MPPPEGMPVPLQAISLQATPPKALLSWHMAPGARHGTAPPNASQSFPGFHEVLDSLLQGWCPRSLMP